MRIRDKHKNCIYSFGIKRNSNNRWEFVGNFILHFDEKSKFSAKQILPKDVGFIEKHFNTEEEIVEMGKKIIQEYLERLNESAVIKS